jgi:serine/threonine protein kinase
MWMSPYRIAVVEKGGERKMYLRLDELSEEEKKESVRWRAPEMKEGKKEKQKMESCVVYSLGLMIYEMITGEVVLNEMSGGDAFSLLSEGERPSLEGIEHEKAAQLIKRMWDGDWKNRPKLREIMNDLQTIIETSQK